MTAACNVEITPYEARRLAHMLRIARRLSEDAGSQNARFRSDCAAYAESLEARALRLAVPRAAPTSGASTR